MQAEHMEIAERLARCLPALSPTMVAGVVAQCAEDFPAADPHFIEQAGLARLREQQVDGMPLRGPLPRAELSLSSQYAELRAEAALCTRLIVAAIGATQPLTQAEVDQILGVDRA